MTFPAQDRDAVLARTIAGARAARVAFRRGYPALRSNCWNAYKRSVRLALIAERRMSVLVTRYAVSGDLN